MILMNKENIPFANKNNDPKIKTTSPFDTKIKLKTQYGGPKYNSSHERFYSLSKDFDFKIKPEQIRSQKQEKLIEEGKETP